MKGKVLIAGLLAAGLLAGCTSQPTPPPRALAEPAEEEVENAKNRVLHILVDPESARFSDIYATKDPRENEFFDRAVCGYVNSKNRMGGYAGRTPFAVYGNRAAVADRGPRNRNSSNNTFIARWCQVRR